MPSTCGPRNNQRALGSDVARNEPISGRRAPGGEFGGFCLNLACNDDDGGDNGSDDDNAATQGAHDVKREGQGGGGEKEEGGKRNVWREREKGKEKRGGNSVNGFSKRIGLASKKC